MLRKRLLAVAALATLTTVTACGGGTNSGGSASGTSVTSLNVLDYFSDEPGHTFWTNLLSTCGKSIGVTTVNHQSVPGPTLIQKVLQQASSRTLPDVLMLDNPDIQQIAATGALAPLNTYGINSDGYAPGPSPLRPTRASCMRSSPAPTPSPSSTTRMCSPRPASPRPPPGPS